MLVLVAVSRPVCLAYQLCFFSERTMFFSHNKSANNTFQLGFSTVRRSIVLASWCHTFRACLDAQKHPKFFVQYPSHRIFGRMHGALNVDKK
jgi:hypothetical protein